MKNTFENQPIVISYKRFSSLKQGRGHSIERQTDAAEKWCIEKGWKLDHSQSLIDRGKSGFTGANRHKGALKTLLEQIERGDIKAGTYLLIEALDRLTREELTSSIPLFLALLDAGLVIVTLVDGKEWTKKGMNSNPSDFMFSIMLLGRGHEESLRKAKMIRAKFASARESGQKIFGSAPGWLTRTDKDAPWTVVPERVESVKKVFELAALGLGSKSIAKIANDNKWPLPTRDTNAKTKVWHGTMPGRLLRLRTVLGEHEYVLQHHEAKKRSGSWRGEKTGMVVKDYYPRIIDDDVWHKARAVIDRKIKTPRRRDEHYFNIWSGLLRCGECGAMIQRKHETRGKSRAQLVCSNKIAGVTDCRTGAASKTDQYLLSDICAYAGAELGLGYNKNELIEEIDIAYSRLNENESSSAAIAEAIARVGAMPALLDQAQRLMRERNELLERIEKNKQKMSLEPNSLLDDSYAEEVLAALYEKNDTAKLLRVECNTRLSRAVQTIWHFAYDVAIVKYIGSYALQTIQLEGKLDGGLHPKQVAWLTGNIQLPGLEEMLLEDAKDNKVMQRGIFGVGVSEESNSSDTVESSARIVV